VGIKFKETMKIPKTTKNKPYIKFLINKKGEIKLSATSDWWGGINSRFTCSNGSQGNTCKPKDLERYVKKFKEFKIKSIEKQITALQKELKVVKLFLDNIHEQTKK
jgi:hypothetical protein